MVPRIHAGGKSFGGLVEYLTHDAAIPGDRHPNTGERVGWVEVENLPDCQPRTVAAVMRATARDAAVLKALAGVSAKGRALSKPVYHYSLSWAKDEGPTRDDMLTAARESLQTLGMRDRQALIVQHTDRAHRHCHIVVNRVSPEDGRAASRTHDARALSTWARTWERERGGIRCHGRPVPPVERAVAVVTHVVTKHELPPRPPRPQRRRGPGRDGTGWRSRQEWTELYDRQRREATASGRPLEKHSSDPHHCIERRELAQAQRRVADEERATAIHSGLPKYVPADAWQQWNGIRRDDASAREVEPRLPHVGGVLAVSDWTFAQLARATTVSPDWKGALAAIHLDHLVAKDGEQRSQAERAYHITPAAVEAERRRQATVNAAEYRAGTCQTPRVPSWSEAAHTLLGNMAERVTEVVKRAYRELAHLSARFDRLTRPGVLQYYDPHYRPGQEHGEPRFRTLGPDEPREHNPAAVPLKTPERTRDREPTRGPDIDIGPSR